MFSRPLKNIYQRNFGLKHCSFFVPIIFEDHNLLILRMILISFTIYFRSTRDFDRYRSLMLFLISGYLFQTYVVNTLLRFRSLIISSLICYLLSSLFRKYFAIHIVLLARLVERMISLMPIWKLKVLFQEQWYYSQWWIANGSDDKTDINFVSDRQIFKIKRILVESHWPTWLWKRYIWIERT